MFTVNTLPLPLVIKINGNITTKMPANDDIKETPKKCIEKAIEAVSSYNEPDEYDRAMQDFIWPFLRQIIYVHHASEE